MNEQQSTTKVELTNHAQTARKSVCVISSTRADYGILLPLLRKIKQDPMMELRIVATGTHLSAEFGHTVDEIEADGFAIDRRIPILQEADNAQGVSCTMAAMLTGLSAYIEERRPDIAILLGDRFEIFAAAAALVNARVPIAHLHGGETTEGAADECFRHGITKMSSLHFTSCEAYRKRVIQLGENPQFVFNVGAMGVENALHTHFVSLDELERILDFPLSDKPFAVVTFHPATLEEDTALIQVEELLAGISACNEIRFVITKANADAGGRRINARLEAYSADHANCRLVSSLGIRNYMSALRYALLVVGNSSSGIIEAPAFGIPTVNIGDRQRGRIQAESVINCAPERGDILRAIREATTEAFLTRAKKAENPYGGGETSARIHTILRDVLVEGPIDLKKKFYDIDFSV